MLILDAVTKSLKIVLAGAVATTQLPVTAHYTDITTTAYTPGSNDTVTNSTTVVEFVAAPAASTQRHVESISVYNVDTASATVTIQYVSAGGTRQVIKVVLLTLEALYYEDGTGWQTIDANGQIKLSASSDKVSHSLATAISDMLFASGVGQFIKKTLAEGRTLLGLDGAITTIAVGGGTGVAPVWTAATGTGAPVRATSPTLVTPLLGTPTSGVLTNATGLPLAGLVPGTAESDFICATTTPFTWVKKTLVEAKALLGLVITAGKTITVTQNTSLDEAGAMSSKAPKAQDAWTDASLLNSWVVMDANADTPGYYKDTIGNVHIRGRVKNGTSLNAVIFTLPSGYRPEKYPGFAIISNDVFSGISINPSGDVAVSLGTGSTTYVDLGGISFRPA